MPIEFVKLAGLPAFQTLSGDGAPGAQGIVAVRLHEFRPGMEGRQEPIDRVLSSRRSRAVGGAGDELNDGPGFGKAGNELARPQNLALDRFQSWRGDLARRSSLPGRIDELGAAGRLDDERSGRDQGRQFGAAELVEQAEDVAVDRLGPDRVAVVEVAAHAGRIDPRVECRGVRARSRPPSPWPKTPIRAFLSEPACFESQSTKASTFCTS